MESQYMTATDLMKYLYCPRILYFMYVIKKPQSVTKKEEVGIKKENDFKSRGKRTKIVKNYPALPKIFKVHLASEKLGIKTICDSIMINKEKGEAYPIQAKYAYKPRAIYKTMRMQICMEALLIEEILKYKAPYGFVKFLKSGNLVKINTNSKEDVISVFDEIKKMTSSESFPKKTKYSKRCVDCCFKNIC